MVSSLVVSYGYLAIFVGTLLEGETILLAAGFAMHRGMLDWRLVLIVAILGATIGDQCAFLLGRWKGTELIARFPALERNVDRVKSLMERYHALFILIVRFLYGLRIAGPLVLGSGSLPLIRFALLNLVGAVLWASIVLGAGYSFGLAVEAMLADVKRYEEIVLIGILIVGLLYWIWRRTLTSSRKR